MSAILRLTRVWQSNANPDRECSTSVANAHNRITRGSAIEVLYFWHSSIFNLLYERDLKAVRFGLGSLSALFQDRLFQRVRGGHCGGNLG